MDKLNYLSERTIHELKLLAETPDKLSDAERDYVGQNVWFWDYLLETHYRHYIHAYFGSKLRRLKEIKVQDLEDVLEAYSSDEDVYEVLQTDLILSASLLGITEPSEVWLSIEIAPVIDVEDVENAKRGASLLRALGYPAVAAVAGEDVTNRGASLALSNHVAIFQNGLVHHWNAAIAEL